MTSRFEYFPANAPGGKGLRLSRILNKSGAEDVSYFTCDYDSNGRITQWDQVQAGVLRATSFEYDRASQLKRASTTTSGVASVSRWLYDAAGNRTMASSDTAAVPAYFNRLNQLTRLGGSGQTLIEGTVNELASVTVNGQPVDARISPPGSGQVVFQKTLAVEAGTNTVEIQATDGSGNETIEDWQFTVPSSQTTLTYDVRGNLRNDGLKAYTWDAENRLTSVRVGSDTYSWKYDGLDRRVEERRNGTLTKRFIWDGLDLIERRDAQGRALEREYSNGVEVGGSQYVLTFDHLGSVRDVLNNAGQTVASFSYDSWGNRTLVSGADPGISMGFTGHELHAGSGLVIAPFRSYDAGLGRWLSRDPLESAEMLQGPNLYRYAANSPGMYIDRDGRFLFMPAIGAGLGAISSAISNYQSFKGGCMSAEDYARSVLFGAGTGALAGFAPGIGSGALLGGLGAAANTLFSQSYTGDGSLDFGEAAGAGVAGAIAGGVAGAAQNLGRQFITYNRGNFVGRRYGHQWKDWGNPAGAAGNAIGTAATTSSSGCD